MDLVGYGGIPACHVPLGLVQRVEVDRVIEEQRRHALGPDRPGLAQQVEERTGHEARTTVLGHIQRGGTPTSFDRVLATRFGLNAIAAVKDGAWGTMVALQGTDIVRVPLQAATGTLKTVPVARYEEAKAFFG